MANVEQSICDAIDIIVDKAVSEAAYDKTVRATIVSCEDESAGYYKLHYQDSTIYAYSLQTDYTYATGTSVYVLVPADDMTNTKTILGTTDKLGNDYIAVIEPEDQFSVVGKNVITCNDTFALQSYRKNGCSINLYNKNNSQNAIDVDITGVEQYFAESDVLICGGVIQTALDREQQTQGDYGILFTLEFKNKSTGEIVERQYPVNVDIMTGQPYNYISPTRQYGIFEFDKENFVDISDITIYCKDFPNSRDNPPDDIFISEIEMEGAVAVSQEDLNGYYLNLVTAKGTYFAKGSPETDTLTAEAVLRDAGKVVNIDSQELPVYWFIEHAGITSRSQYYCSFGGAGWKCLNEYLVVTEATDDAEASVEWIPGNKTFTLAKSDLKAKSAQYKCVVIYNGTAVSATVTFKNLDSDYDITIESTNGTQFYYDVGSTDLITRVNGEEERGSNYSYAWAISDALGNYTTLTNNDEAAAIETEYQEEIKNVQGDQSLYDEQKDALLKELEEEYKELLSQLTFANSNRVENIQASSIYIFNTYKCSVFLYDDFIGTVSITLVNSDEASGYSLVMNNNSYTYKYNEAGVGPTSTSLLNPITLMPLSYNLYDCDGQDITDDVFNVCDVKWYVPSTDVSLLSIPDSYNSYIIGEENNYTIYGNTKTLVYEIATRYSISKSVNDIYLTVGYEDMLLVAKSNLTFVKEGENGTNGTEYSCKIVPYVRDNGVVPTYPIVSMYKTGTDSNGDSVYNNYSYNYTVMQNQPFTLQLYHNETLVFNSPSSGTTEDESLKITLKWSALCNKYSLGVYDDTNLTVTSASTGVIEWNPQKFSNPANIIKVEVDVEDETVLYATLPVISVWYDDDFDYTLKLRENTGFLYATYASDGTSPQWDNLKPFTFDYTKVVDGIECNINKEVNRASKTVLGQVYESENKIWKDDINLEDYASLQREEEDFYEWWLKPSDSYDGWCVTNAVKYSCGTSDKLVASIHVPVHLMINRYGLASLNGWDGNSVQIDEEGGFILAPQIGAGHKESDNSFTGMVMGDVRESGNSSYNVASGLETGLFAYNSGRRTIFLDATTGKSIFGMTGMGQIIIDPGDGTEPHAQIYSGNYYYDDNETLTGEGLCIDLIAPYIKYGNGNFEVDEEGNLTAKGHGHIAGWYIDDYTIYTAPDSSKAPSYTYNDELDTADVYISSAQFTKTINNEKLSNLRISVGDNFGLTATGEVYSNTLHVGAGKNKIIISEELDDEGNIVEKETVIVDDDGNTEEVSTHSAIYYQKQGFKVNKTGFYLGTDGIALGDYNSIYGHSMFEVDASSGEFVARNGYIGTRNYGWRIEDTYMYNAKSYFEDPTKGIFIGTGKYQYPDDATDEDRAKTYGGIAIGEYNERYYSTSPFQVTIDGELTARSGYIGDYRNGWWIEDTYLYNGQKEINPKEDAVDEDGKSIYQTSGIYLGINGIGLGNGYFYVTNDGYLYAQGGGTLAGWTIDDYSIYTGDEEVDLRISSRDTANVRLSAGTFRRYIEGFSSNEDDPIKDLRFAIGNKFAVDNQGNLYANNANIKGNFDIQGSGTISGWSIDEYSIYTGKSPSYRGGDENKGEVDTVDVILSSSKFYKNNINSISREDWRITVGDNFGITSDGDVYATTIYVGGELSTGTVSRQKLTLTTDGSKAAIYYNKTSCDITSIRNGFYIGTDGIAIGKYFKVDTDADTADFGGWKLTEDTLYYHGDTVSSQNVILTTRDDLSGIINRSNTIDNLRFTISNKFGVDGDGHLYASEGTLGSGNYLITLGQGENNSATHACIYGRSHSSLNDDTDGYYLGTDGLSIGKYFSVDEQGKLTAKHIIATNDGNIAGWSISSTALTSGNITISSSGSITGGTDGGNYWSISNDGSVNFNSGSIGGWTLTSTSLYAGTSSSSPSNIILSSSNFNRDINSISRSSLRMAFGQNFAVSDSGVLYAANAIISGNITANSGTIGGLTINSNTLSDLSSTVTNINNTYVTNNTYESGIKSIEDLLGYWEEDSSGAWTNGVLSLSNTAINTTTSTSTLYLQINGNTMMTITRAGNSAVYIDNRLYIENEPFIEGTRLTQYIQNVVNAM